MRQWSHLRNYVQPLQQEWYYFFKNCPQWFPKPAVSCQQRKAITALVDTLAQTTRGENWACLFSHPRSSALETANWNKDEIKSCQKFPCVSRQFSGFRIGCTKIALREHVRISFALAKRQIKNNNRTKNFISTVTMTWINLHWIPSMCFMAG